MLDLTNERKATNREKEIAQETYTMMQAAGFSGTYAGGSKSKGNGFWIRKGNKTLGYMRCSAIQAMIKG